MRKLFSACYCLFISLFQKNCLIIKLWMYDYWACIMDILYILMNSIIVTYKYRKFSFRFSFYFLTVLRLITNMYMCKCTTFTGSRVWNVKWTNLAMAVFINVTYSTCFTLPQRWCSGSCLFMNQLVVSPAMKENVSGKVTSFSTFHKIWKKKIIESFCLCTV